MKTEVSRTTHSKRNITSGLIKQMTNVILSFVIRTLVIYYLGPEYQGLSGLFTSILQMLNLADLGFSTAVLFVLYKPIAENDKEAICGIINFLRKVYFIVGFAIWMAGLIILPFLRYLISGEISVQINIYLLFIIYLLNTVISYMFFAYKSTLVSAMQNENVVSNIYTISFIFVKIIQVIIIVAFGVFLSNNQNAEQYYPLVYYSYVGVIIFGTILNNVTVQIVSKKMFPSIVPSGPIPDNYKNQFKRQISSIFIGKISDVARNSLDNIIISAFLGLIMVTAYDNYYYIYSSLYAVTGIIIRGIMASVGNSIVTESVEKNYNDLMKINFIFMLITGWFTICMYCLYQPFMAFWMKDKPELLLSDFQMTLMCVYFYAINMTYVRSMYLDGNGLFRECRWWCVAEAIANLVLNILLGKLLGLTGIIVATIVTIIVFNFFGRSRVLFKKYFITGKFKFYLYHLIFLIVTFGIGLLSRFVCSFIPLHGAIQMLLIFICCSALTFLIYFLVYFKTKIFKESSTLFLRLLPKRFRRN